MSKKQDRVQMCSDIKQAAQQYDRLVGKTFMYVFNDRYIEVIFRRDNFKHLTGVESQLSAERFFSYAKRGILTEVQFTFSERHKYKLARKKTDNIINIPILATGECFMLENITTKSEVYKFAGTDLNITLLFEKEKNNNSSGDLYFAKSLRVEDCFSKSQNVYTVTHIFSKPNSEKKYDRLLYMDKNSVLEELPLEIRELISDELFALGAGSK